MIHDRPPRLRDFDYRGFHRRHLRTSTWNRRPLLPDSSVACLVRSHLFHFAVQSRVAVRAYRFMPDHVHLLAQGASCEASVCDFVSRWKQQTGYLLPARRGVRLWQPGYFDRVLREDESDVMVARYIIENPMRAGLSRRYGEYPFAWCVWGSELLYGDARG